MPVATRGTTRLTGFNRNRPELPSRTNDLQASKSRTKSATWLAATSMPTFISKPLCAALGVVSAVSLPPLGTRAFAVGLPASLAAGRQRRLAEVGEHAVGQRQQVDALRRSEHHLGPAGLVVAGACALVDTHLLHRHVDVV